MKCKKCGKEAKAINDYNEAQGGKYLVMYFCENCHCEVEDEYD